MDFTHCQLQPYECFWLYIFTFIILFISNCNLYIQTPDILTDLLCHADVTLWASSHSSCQHSDASHPTCNGIGEIYQIVGNTKDINTHISAIYHGCRCISVATVIYFSAGAHLSCDGEISSTQSGWRTECSHTHINTQNDEIHPCATSRSPHAKR